MATATKSIKKVSAKELNSIADLYLQARADYCACVGQKEIEAWIFSTECMIDRQVKILDRGVTKQNTEHFERVSNAYAMLQKQIYAAHQKLANLKRQ
jgi:hypothetical protein